MVNTVAHQELGGGYAMGPKYIVDTAELSPGTYETMVLKSMRFDEEEVDCRRTDSFEQAKKDFNEFVKKYAGPVQNAFIDAGMKPGGRYTIFRMSEFGFPAAQKITFESMELTTYAQYGDAVALIYKGARKKHSSKCMFYGGSFAICEGWQDLPENFGLNVLHSTPEVTTSISKYHCFDARFFEDIKQVAKNVLVIYENYKKGVDGRMYA